MRLRLLLLVSLLNVFAYAFWGPLFTVYAVSLGASPSLAGSLFAFFAFSHALAILFFGKLDNHSTRFRNVVVGYSIQGLCAILFISISNPIFLFVPLFLSATSGGMIAPAWKALYTNALTKDKEGTEWSYADAGTYFATSAGAFLAGLIANTYSYKAIFVPLLVINLATSLILVKKRHLLQSQV